MSERWIFWEHAENINFDPEDGMGEEPTSLEHAEWLRAKKPENEKIKEAAKQSNKKLSYGVYNDINLKKPKEK